MDSNRSTLGRTDLRESAQSLLLEEFTPAHLVLDAEFRIAHLSKSAGKYLASTEDALLCNVMEAVRYDLRPHLEIALNEAAEHRRTAVREDVEVHADGDSDRVRLTVRPLPPSSEAAHRFLVVLETLNTQLSGEAGRATAEFRVAQNRVTDILDSISDGFVSLDRNWKCTYLNQPAARLLQCDPHAVLGRNLWDALPKLKGTTFEAELRQCLNSGKPAAFEVFLKPYDQWFECHSYLAEEFLSVFFTDITAWKHEQLLAEKSGERIERAINEAAGGFWDIEFKNPLEGSIPENIYFSPRLKILLGYTPEELPNRFSAWLELVHPEDRRRLQNAMREHIRGVAPQFECEYRLRSRGEEYRWLQSRGNIVRNADGHPVRWTAVMLDITRKKQEEERLARLASIVESSQDGIIGMALDGTVKSWNPGAERLFGFTAKQAIGKKIIDLIVPAERVQELQKAMHRVSQGMMFPPFETQRHNRKGQILEVLVTLSPLKNRQGKIIGMSAIDTDITMKKQMEAQTRRLNRTLHEVLRAFPDIVWVMDRNHELKFFNPAAARFLSSSSRVDALPPAIQEEIQKALVTGSDYLPKDFRGVHCIRIEGEDRYFLCRLVAMKDESGALFGLTVMLQDVTDFRMLDEVKTNLIGTVSHELKTPVTSIRMSLLLLLEEQIGKLNREQRELISVARDEVERLLRILSTLLDITRFEEGRQALEVRKTNAAELVKCAIEEARATAQNAGIHLATEVPEDLPPIEVDADRIIHALVNLVTNAIKHSPENATVQIQVQTTEANQFRFSVIDQGPGIPQEYQDRVFDKFFKVPGNKQRGTGLGLAIVREFVNAHGGSTGVHSEPGQGSEFFFVLPEIPMIQDGL